MKNSKNDNIIYGVDITKKVTPIMVRDAIIQCFFEAHCSVLELARETFGHPSEEIFEDMKKSHVNELVHDIFIKIKGDFNNQTKDDLLLVFINLKFFASISRSPKMLKNNVAKVIK